MIENAKLLQAIQNIINQSYSSGDEYSYRGGRDWYNEQAEGNDFHKLVRARDAMKKGNYDKYADFVAALVGTSNDYTNPQYMSPYEPELSNIVSPQPVSTARETGSVEMKSDTVPKSHEPSYDDVHHDVMMRGGSFPIENGVPISAQLKSKWLYSYPEAQKNIDMILDQAKTDPDGALMWARAFVDNMGTLERLNFGDGQLGRIKSLLLAEILGSRSPRQATAGRDMTQDKLWPATQPRNPY